MGLGATTLRAARSGGSPMQFESARRGPVLDLDELKKAREWRAAFRASDQAIADMLHRPLETVQRSLYPERFAGAAPVATGGARILGLPGAPSTEVGWRRWEAQATLRLKPPRQPGVCARLLRAFVQRPGQRLGLELLAEAGARHGSNVLPLAQAMVKDGLGELRWTLREAGFGDCIDYSGAGAGRGKCGAWSMPREKAEAIHRMVTAGEADRG